VLIDVLKRSRRDGRLAFQLDDGFHDDRLSPDKLRVSTQRPVAKPNASSR
jgi:hypothetical protein